MGEQCVHLGVVGGMQVVQALINPRPEPLERFEVGGIQHLLAEEPPEPFDEVQVRRVARQEQQLDPQRLGQPLHQLTPLVAGVVQYQRDRHPQPPAGQRPQQGADRLRVDVAVVGHPEDLVRHRVEGPQHVVALPTRRGADELPGQAPQEAQERGEHEVGGVDEEHRPLAPARRGEPGLQLFLQELGLRAGVVLGVLLGRAGDGPGLEVAQPQVRAEKGADLGQAAPDAGLLRDNGLGLAGRAGRVVPEMLLQGEGVFGQGSRAGPLPGDTPDGVEPAPLVRSEVALEGGPGDAGEGGHLRVRQARGLLVGLEPEHFHLPLDARVGVVVAETGDGLEVGGGECEGTHGQFPG